MPKKPVTKSAKSQLGDREKKEKTENEITEEEIMENRPPDYRTITMVLENYENIISKFASAKIVTNCQYLGEELGRTEELPITDSEILEINQEFCFKIDINSEIDLDRLISNPIILIISQLPFATERYAEELSSMELEPDRSSINSIISLYEAFTGDIVLEKVTMAVPEKMPKEIKKTDRKKSVKNSETPKPKGSKEIRSENTRKQVPVSGPTVFGQCILDLFPLFLGKKNFSERLPIELTETFHDDRMVTYKMKPRLMVSVRLDQLFSFETEPTILNLIVESIYNIPSSISEEAECRICLNLPKLPIVMGNGFYSENLPNKFIYWPNNNHLTKYEINDDKKIQNNTEINLGNESFKENPKIIFNCLKRNIIFRDNFYEIYDHLCKYRKFVLEIFIQLPNKKNSPTRDKKDKNIKDQSSKSSKSDNRKSPSEQNGNKSKSELHFMALVDLTSLLYPGISRVRVACPLTEFDGKKAEDFARLSNSYFFPKNPKFDPEIVTKGTKEKTKETKEKPKTSQKLSSKRSEKSSVEFLILKIKGEL